MKYKVGDVVTVIIPKDRTLYPTFTSAMEQYIGKDLVVTKITDRGYLYTNVDWVFHADWVVPYKKILNGVLSEGGNI